MALNDQIGTLPSVDSAASISSAAIVSKIPEAPIQLNDREKEVWDHVTKALLEYQRIHLTDAMMLVVIVRTFVEWEDARQELDEYKEGNRGSYITETPNGYRQPHPLYYIVRDKKRELLRWLPEAALTIPSFAKIKSGQLAESAQSDLFNDPLSDYKNSKPPIRLVSNGKG